MDKVVGRALLDGQLPLSGRVLVRQRTAVVRARAEGRRGRRTILIGVGAPSSLAIELADDRGLTLCGFARRGTVNVYTRPRRIAPDRTARHNRPGSGRGVRHQLGQLLLGGPCAHRRADEPWREMLRTMKPASASRPTSASSRPARGFHATSVERPRGPTSSPRSARLPAEPGGQVSGAAVHPVPARILEHAQRGQRPGTAQPGRKAVIEAARRSRPGPSPAPARRRPASRSRATARSARRAGRGSRTGSRCPPGLHSHFWPEPA